VGEFTWELYRLLGIKLAATTAYHPQGDGQTERVNQELEQSSVYSSTNTKMTGMNSFRLRNFNTTTTFILLLSKFHSFWIPIPRMGFEPRECRSHMEGVNEFKDRMKEALDEAKAAALTKSKDDMARYYDRKRTPAPEYRPRDKVYLDASNIQTT
jgi:hypothetical protein